MSDLQISSTEENYVFIYALWTEKRVKNGMRMSASVTHPKGWVERLSVGKLEYAAG
jgi:hypothetical protein